MSTALRRTGSPELAQEAAQNVFASLARKAPRLTVGGTLAPWLHRAVVLETAALLRRESRYRHAMERQRIDAAIHSAQPPAACDLWEAIRPEVDEAMNSLSEPERGVLLLHHIEGRTYSEIARLLGLTEAAAQRRGHRALQKLADRLRRRGVTVPALALGSLLAAELAGEAAASTGHASSLTTAELTTTALTRVSMPNANAVSPWATWTLSPMWVPAVVLCTVAMPIIWRGTLQASRDRTPVTASLAVAGSVAPPAIDTSADPTVDPESRLTFLRLAMEKLSRTRPDEIPTKLGLQLRQYMLGLSADDLRPVGALLSGASRSHLEVLAVIQAFSTRLAELEPRLALELAQATSGAHPDPDFNRSIDKLALLDVLTRREIADVLAAARADHEFGYYMLARWANHDPLGAIAFSEQTFEGDLRMAGVHKSFRVWLAHQPAKALTWLDGHQDYHELFLRSPDPENTAVRSLTARQAAELVASVKDPLLRNAALEQAYRTYGKTQPEALVAMAPFMPLEEGGRTVGLARWLRTWHRSDATAAAAWVADLPDGDLKTAAAGFLNTPDPPAPF